MSNYTMETDLVEHAAAVWHMSIGAGEATYQAGQEHFRAWLAQHDAEVRTAALNAAADALPESTPPLGGPLAISPAVHARVQEWLRAQAGGAA